MLDTLLEKRNEVNVPVIPFEYVRPTKQDKFNEIFKEAIYSGRPVILPQDDDVDGFVSAFQLKETIQFLNPKTEVLVYIPEEKTHGVDEKFIEYVKGYDKPIIFVTDSSSSQISELKVLTQISTLAHIDHHISENETELNNICDLHANSRYGEDERLSNISAGLFITTFIRNYLVECTTVGEDYINTIFSLGVLSLVADVCDTQLEYNKSAIAHYRLLPNQHQLLECFTTRYTANSLYFLAFTVAPKLNMLFRLRYVEELRLLHYTSDLETVVENMLEMYTNYKSIIEQSLLYLQVYDYGKVVLADVSYENDICPAFRGRAANFTGWYANRISQEHLKPCIIICGKKGSVRDCTGADIYTLMEDADFLEGGGHPSAYGFKMEPEDLAKLIYHFDQRYEGNIAALESTEHVTTLGEISNIAKNGTLLQMCEYNEYTLNNKVGFNYKIKAYDVVDKYEKYAKLKSSDLDIISFDNTLQSGDIIELIPGYNTGRVQLIATIIGREGN